MTKNLFEYFVILKFAGIEKANKMIVWKTEKSGSFEPNQFLHSLGDIEYVADL